jgi:acetylornithine deacetylase
MKGGIVAAVVALLALRKLGYRPAGRLHFETVPEEENTGNGALSCCARGYAADAVIIPEPFGDVISIAQCGVMWMTVELDGKPAHVLDTTAGVSAIQAAYSVFEHLKKLEVCSLFGICFPNLCCYRKK